MEPEASKHKILTAQDVGRYLRISLSTVHHLTRTGQIKAVKVGKQWRYYQEDLDRYLEEGFEHLKSPAVSPQPLRKPAYAGDERRAHPRIKCFVQGTLLVPDPAQEILAADGHILDLSAGGLLFETPEDSLRSIELGDDTRASVRLFLPSSSKQEVELEGVIRHRKANGALRLGLKFQKEVPEVAALLSAS